MTRLFLLAVAAFALGCTESGGTTIRLDVTYSDALTPDTFRMVTHGTDHEAAPAHELQIIVPDDWAGEPLDISLDAMAAGQAVAHGDTQVTPIAGDEVHGSIALSGPSCDVSCIAGSTRCEGDGVVTCGTGEDGCPIWGEPIACGAGTTCSNGDCSSTCTDECATGGARCLGNQVQICGQADSDSCRDWKTPTSCGAGETCSNGACAETCVDECEPGAKRCDMNGVETCGNYDSDSCRDWSSAATCNNPPAATCADANTLRTYGTGTCDSGTTACTYASTDMTCANGCIDGACAGTAAEVALAADTSCERRIDGTLACWGRNDYSTSTVPSGAFTQISAGTFPNGTGHTFVCARNAAGTVTCWGYSGYTATTVPAGPYSSVSATGLHACGVKTNGSLACWGYSGEGTLAAAAGSDYIGVESGGDASCGLHADGSVSCWGPHSYGSATPPAGTVLKSLALTGGGEHLCGIKTDDTVVCWGNNGYQQLNTPTGTFKSVSAGGFSNCGIRMDGTLACWGSNDKGQSSPPSGTFISVAAGYQHSCGVRTNRQIVCWGDNTYGQVTVP